MKKTLLISTVALTVSGMANAALWVDFNSTSAGGQDSTAPNNQAGYEAFTKGHEAVADLGPTGARSETYSPTFLVTGAATVTLTVDWTNTTDIRVRQSIDRNSNGPPISGNDNNWNNSNGDLDLATDFLGIDTRTGSGGNGDWDGTIGTPTYMTLTLNGLAAGNYDWTSFHADTENVHVNFQVEINTGTGFSTLADGSMTDASPGGTPDSTIDGSGLSATSYSALNTYTTSFTADGTNDVTLRFAPYSGAVVASAVHNQIWGINGFQLTQIPEPSAGILGLLGAALLIRRRR